MKILNQLEEIIAERRVNPTAVSYTAELFASGEDRVIQKVGEEAIELIIAAKGEGKERIISETADLLFHLLIMLNEKGVQLAEIEAELQKRRGGG